MMRASKKEQKAADPFSAGGAKLFLLLLILGCLAASALLSIKLGRAAEGKLALHAQQQEAKMMAGFVAPMKDNRDEERLIASHSPEEEQRSMADFRAKMNDRLKNRTTAPRPLAPKTDMYPKWAVSSPTPLAAQAPQILPTFQRPDGGAFIHMGKTGGSALSILLRNGCHSWMPHPCRNITNETIVSELIESYYHVPDFAFLRQSQHDFYVMTMRDPFDRVVSAFVFEHILNRIVRDDVSTLTPYKQKVLEGAYNCFPSLEHFVRYLKGNSTSFSYPYKKNAIMPKPCKYFARAAFHGKVRPFNHMYFSYKRIKSFLPAPESQTIFVTRQENLWEDWKSINKWLGPDREVVLPATTDHAEVRNTTHLQLPVSRALSPEGVQTLCAALQEEYNVYVWFLSRAKNLNTDDVLKSVGRARRRCPQLRIDLSQLKEKS
jgi:hypothetical protein